MINARDAKALSDSFAVDTQTKDGAMVIIENLITDAANNGRKDVIIPDSFVKAAMFEKALLSELKEHGYTVTPGRAQYRISWDKTR